MRLVCKEWYVFINHFEAREELCVYDQKIPRKLKWSSDDADVREAIKVKSSQLDFSQDPFLKSLKRLFIFEISKPGLLETVNNLTNLEELCFTGYDREPVKLNLANLKTLTSSCDEEKTVLNTPKLENLKFKFLQSLMQITHPNSIRSFICGHLCKINFKFPNLRRLVLRYIQSNIQINLEDFPELKVVELYTYIKPSNFLAKNLVKSLKKQISVLGRSDLLVLVKGFKDLEVIFEMIGGGCLFAKIDFNVVWNNFDQMVGDFESRASFFFEDYHLLRTHCPTSEERRKFLKKFKMMTLIQANEITNPTEFFEFLNECGSCVETLDLRNSAPLFTRYARQLTTFQSIKKLEVREYEFDLNFNFLFDLKNLEGFELHTFKEFFSLEHLRLAADLFKKNPNFLSSRFCNLGIRRARNGSSLAYNGIQYEGKTLEEIFRIYVKIIDYCILSAPDR